MRAALIGLLFVLSAWAHSVDILILVHQSDAGSGIPIDGYSHPTWILWPKASNPAQSNRLFSLPSGVDWQAGKSEDAFVAGEGQARVAGHEKWRQRGYFQATNANLGRPVAAAPSRKPNSLPSNEVLKAALANPDFVPLLGRTEAWPENVLVVAEASGRNPWDEVAFLVRKAGGRALVVEYPEDSSTMWSRFWLQGRGWPEGAPTVSSTRIPGLIPARKLMALLDEPSIAKWSEGFPAPANRWLRLGHETAPVALVFLAVASIYIIGLGIYCALREQYSRIVVGMIRVLVSGPAALILGGKLTSLFGPDSWVVWHLAAFAGVNSGAWIIGWIAGRWSDVHPLWGEFAVGAIVCGACDPVWSMFSNVLGPHRAPTSPEAFGALAAYIVGTLAMFPSRAWPRIGALVLVVGSLALTKRSGWLDGLSSAFVVLAMAIGFLAVSRRETSWRAYAPLYALAIGAGLVCALWKPGLAYAPQGLVYTYAQFGKFNCAEQIAFLLSPTFIAFCVLALVAAIAGDNFLGHQARRAMSFSPKPKAFFPVAVCFLVAGIFIPLYLHAFLATAIAGSVAVLFDAIRSP